MKIVNVNGVDYSGVSKVQLNTADGGTALFQDVDEITTPSGTKNITANGTYDVSAYAQSVVNVPTDGTSGGAGGDPVELYSKAITEAANLIAIPYDSAWDSYSALVLVLEGITPSASDFLRVGLDNTAISGNGFYPAGAAKITEYNGTNMLLLRFGSAMYLVEDDNSNRLVEIPTLSTINIFATTSTTNITAGTIKILGVQ